MQLDVNKMWLIFDVTISYAVHFNGYFLLLFAFHIRTAAAAAADRLLPWENSERGKIFFIFLLILFELIPLQIVKCIKKLLAIALYIFA